ncbi:hypothetical protein [Naasia lichenicola]|uniref:hypothetical protein n=1 Tax=Naasia lichenicola TaxID=2565933 RepID=UPI00130ED5C3|nr:hypothetical protein [Naasia lichenicola]
MDGAAVDGAVDGAFDGGGGRASFRAGADAVERTGARGEELAVETAGAAAEGGGTNEGDGAAVVRVAVDGVAGGAADAAGGLVGAAARAAEPPDRAVTIAVAPSSSPPSGRLRVGAGSGEDFDEKAGVVDDPAAGRRDRLASAAAWATAASARESAAAWASASALSAVRCRIACTWLASLSAACCCRSRTGPVSPVPESRP